MLNFVFEALLLQRGVVNIRVKTSCC